MNLNNLKYGIIIMLLATISCVGNQSADKKGGVQDSLESNAKNITLKTTDYYIVGNFEGREKDTIFFHYYSHRLKRETNQIPSSDNNWDDIIDWFNYFQVETYFTYKNDTLKIGEAYGLYCLLNMGDVNSDGKDEFAFVVDRLDYSQLNHCEIYTVCQSQFYLLKSFAINESAFDATKSDTPYSPTGIKDFLEKKNNVWHYCSYDDYMENDAPDMKVLKLNKCR